MPSEFIKDEWERSFVESFTEDQLVDLLQAANYLNIPALFELCCAKIASEYKGKSFDDIRTKYGLEDVEFTQADEEEILKQYPWIVRETQEKIDAMKQNANGVK